MRRLVIALTLLASWPALAETKTVHVGVVERPDLAPFVLALYGGRFAAHGLEVEPVVGTSGQDFVAALATGQMEVASGVPNAGLYNALNRGIDIRLVADYAHVSEQPEDSTVSIIARADLMDNGTIKTPADLKGRTIGAGPQPGQYPQLLFSEVLALGHLTLDDVTVRYLPFPETLAAMGTKTIDAAFMIEPLVTQADHNNIARKLVPAGAVDPGAELSIVLYSPDFAKDKDAATRYMMGFLEGVRMYQDNFFTHKISDKVMDILTAHLPVKDPNVWRASVPQHTDPNGKINVADLKRQAAFFKTQGTLSGPIPDIDKFVDTSFAEAAVKVLGPR